MLKEHYRLKNGREIKERAELLLKLLPEGVYQYLSENCDLNNSATRIFDSESIFNIDIIERELKSIVNITRVNNIRYINKYFEAVNNKLSIGGIIIGCVETYEQRKKRILNKYNIIVSYPLYVFDFIVKRVLPKLKITRKIYFLITRGNNRAISRVETYGRLTSCGFEFVNERVINNLLFFTFKKVSPPKYDVEPTYGIIAKLKRIGKDGKMITVYKIRTMYAYSEYLQEKIAKETELDIGGKYKNDYRKTHWGRLLRAFWIDEIPMIWNWIKGDLKLVGVRPLSKQYFDSYDQDLKEKRIKYKPGLIPPFYADLPKTLDDIMESERRYLSAYEKNPFKTQWKYFWKAIYNILFKDVRSQ
ncbi:MAG: sugar transferase [Ignavibacteria bacterium]|nr:sugar transferase [Ignavibacteria bacterium]